MNNNQLKQEIKQALEALQSVQGHFDVRSAEYRKVVNAIAALSTEQQEEAQPKQVCDRCKGIGGGVGIDGVEDDCGKCLGTGYAAPAPVQPQEQPKPVEAKHIGFDYLDNGQLVATYAVLVPAQVAPKLYAAPVQPASKPVAFDMAERAAGMIWAETHNGMDVLEFERIATAIILREFDCTTSKEASAPAREPNPKDLRIDSYGGNSNGFIVKPDFGVRITHLPTGIFAECNDDRSQHRNKTKAYALLVKKLAEQPALTRDDVRFAAVKECHRLHKEEGKDYYTFSFVAGWEAALRTQPAQQATTAEPSVPVQAVTGDLPPLPKAYVTIDVYSDDGLVKSIDGYTADQMRGYAIDHERRLLSGSAKTGEAG